MTPKILFSHKNNNKTYNYYSTQIMGSEKVRVNGKHYFLLINSNREVNRWESTKSFYINSNNMDGYSNHCRDCDYNYNQLKRKNYHLVNQSK